MGRKVDPRGLRLKITDTWKSRWFASGKTFARNLEQDHAIRREILKKFPKSGIVRIDIERFSTEINVIIHSTRPGMIIGKGGVGIEELKKQMKQKLNLENNLKITIEESRQINLQAQVWADTLAEQLEKRMSHRRAMKGAIQQIMESGAKGVKIAVAGRLNGADIARTEWLYKGKLPLHTLRTDIDFARSIAHTTYGTIGVKVWINRGEVFSGQGEKDEDHKRSND